MNLQPTTVEEVQAAVRGQPRLLLRGGGSKPALSTPPEDTPGLDLSGLSGILEYEPGEFTFTALAGTSLIEVEGLLARHGQYMPFDPMLGQRGATLGGVVAANTAGPGRYRYGGVRDFLLGIRFVNGEGDLVQGGGKVVKNSAGFDLPKLMVGSRGRLGALVEVTFKVFPGPESYATLNKEYADLEDALASLYRLTTSPLECEAVDLEPARQGGSATLWVRLGGLADALPARLERLQAFLKGGEVTSGPEEASLWQQVREFDWAPAGWTVVKAALTPGRIPALEARFIDSDARRRYAVGGNLAWVAFPPGMERLELFDSILASLDLTGLALWGPPDRPKLGAYPAEALARRIKQALDPSNKFLEV